MLGLFKLVAFGVFVYFVLRCGGDNVEDSHTLSLRVMVSNMGGHGLSISVDRLDVDLDVDRLDVEEPPPAPARSDSHRKFR